MKLRFLALIGLLTTSGATVSSEAQIEPKKQGNVSYLSGGIGEDELRIIRSGQGQYNLHVLFAELNTGENIDRVKVELANEKHRHLLRLLARGPYLMVRLKPGNYILMAEKNQEKHLSRFSVGAQNATSLTVYFTRPGNGVCCN